MSTLRVMFGVLGFLLVTSSYALDRLKPCDVIYLSNNSAQTFEVSGIYSDSQERLKTTILAPYTAQETIVLETLRSCSGNTEKIHCQAMWLVCHPKITLIIKTADQKTILLSEMIHANDAISINAGPLADSPMILINDVPR